MTEKCTIVLLYHRIMYSNTVVQYYYTTLLLRWQEGKNPFFVKKCRK